MKKGDVFALASIFLALMQSDVALCGLSGMKPSSDLIIDEPTGIEFTCSDGQGDGAMACVCAKGTKQADCDAQTQKNCPEGTKAAKGDDCRGLIGYKKGMVCSICYPI